MAKKKTIEQKVSDTMLQQLTTVKFGGKKYDVAPPTIGTLVMLSGKISEFKGRKVEGTADMSEMLASVEDGRKVAECVAILVLGAKRIREDRCSVFHKGVLEKMTDEIVDNAQPEEVYEEMIKLLQLSQLSDFFALSAFLQKTRLVQTTREAEETIQSGQSLQDLLKVSGLPSTTQSTK